MAYNPHKHHRQSIRLKGFDYTQAGAYFVTICIKGGRCVLGEIGRDKMELSEWGRIVEEQWKLMGESRSNVELDEFQVMPNHFHGILWITQPNSTDVRAWREPVGARLAVPNKDESIQTVWLAKPLQDVGPNSENRFGKPKKGSLGTIIGLYKSGVTRTINELEDTQGNPFWQRGYYDQIIRNERHLEAVRKYIRANPANWNNDEFFAP